MFATLLASNARSTPLGRRAAATSWTLAALALVACSTPATSSPPPAAGQPSPAAASPVASTAPVRSLALPLRRGMNLGNALDAPNEGEWGVVLAAADFKAVKGAGFDHVRLPVRFSAHAAASPPYAIEPAFLARVDWAIDRALENGLAVVLDLHHYHELMEDPGAHRARLAGLWRQIAEHERSRPDTVAFELCNEPAEKMTAALWNPILAETLAAVRESNPTRTVVLEGVFWASAQNLRDTLRVPGGDAYLVGSFHMYQPVLFTHQGADFMPPEFATRGVVFPGPPDHPLEPAREARDKGWVRDWFKRYSDEPTARNPSGPAVIADQLDMAKDFADASHLPVYMGEFGTIDNADARSREAWTRLTREEAERRGFGWAYWDDGGKFKILDRSSETFSAPLLAALTKSQ